MNTVALILGWQGVKNKIRPMEACLTIAISALVVSAHLSIATDIQWYAGFSGIAYGLLTLYILYPDHTRWKIRFILAALVLIRLIQQSSLTDTYGYSELIGAQIIDEAHVAGVFAGFICCALLLSDRFRIR